VSENKELEKEKEKDLMVIHDTRSPDENLIERKESNIR